MEENRKKAVRASVILPTRNRRVLLARQLECLADQEAPDFDYEILVVDDGSEDDTAALLDRLGTAQSRLKVIHEPGRGANAARAAGARAARGEFLLFTDDDCTAPRDWGLQCVRGFDRHPEAAGLHGPVRCPRDGITPFTRQIVAERRNRLYYGCNIAYRRSAYEEAGGFDPEIPFSFGDTELAARVLDRGPILWLDPVRMVHPPRPRTYRNEGEWRRTLFGEWMLWRRSPGFYRRTRAPHFLLGVLLHWVIGSTAKELVRHAAFAVFHPARYLDHVARILAERLRLLRVLPGFLAGERRAARGVGPPLRPARPLHVCYFGTYRREYPRNRVLIGGLRRCGVTVTECHRPLWGGIETRVELVRGGWRRVSFLLRVARTYLSLLGAHTRVRDYDLLMVGYPGPFDVFLARILAALRGRPLVWDVFMSIGLVARERGLAREHPRTVGFLGLVERLALRLPNLLLQDTEQYVRWLSRTYGVDRGRFRLVPTGADGRTLRPGSRVQKERSAFLVLYHGTFIPNHGVEMILGAARRLRDVPGILFELIGDGPSRIRAMETARRWGLTNVRFRDWMSHSQLGERLLAADCVAGAFGSTPQSLMTVQNKVCEAMAVGRAVITGDGPAIREAFRHGQEIWLVPRRDPEALARAVLALRASPRLRRRLEREGHRRFLARFSVRRIGETAGEHLQTLVTRAAPERPSRRVS